MDQYKDKVPTNAKKCRSVRVVTKWSATKCLRRVSYREIIATAKREERSPFSEMLCKCIKYLSSQTVTGIELF